MCKDDMFFEILRVVEAETGIDREILQDPKSRNMEVVDARYLLVYFLRHHAGYNIGYIAHLLNMTSPGIRRIVRNFELRREQSGNFFKTIFQQIKNKLKTN